MKIETNLVFRRGCFGEHIAILNRINIMLPCFKTGQHYNNGIRPLKIKYTEKKMITAIIYTLNHEMIHAVQYLIHPCIRPKDEHIVYNMIGNGGNGFINELYGIRKNHKWQKVIGGAK